MYACETNPGPAISVIVGGVLAGDLSDQVAFLQTYKDIPLRQTGTTNPHTGQDHCSCLAVGN